MRRSDTAPPPQVVEVELYPSNRTDAEIIADQKKDMADKRRRRKREATAIPRSSRNSSGCELTTDRRFMDEALSARRRRAWAKRAQPQRRLRDRFDRGRMVGEGATAPAADRTPKPLRSSRPEATRDGRHGLRHARALRSRERARSRLHRSAARSQAGADRHRAEGSRPAHLGQRASAACAARGSRSRSVSAARRRSARSPAG